ncbi:MAG TPA: NAD-dependent deacylase [Marmoricola sp.]|nr:NAD-dependent deacylase [Marmoricola sp.]
MKVVVLTGAGISAESGVPTFRDADGLWEGYRPEEVATPEAFEADREMVQRFYDERRASLARVRPNAAHLALAELEDLLGEDFFLITQNIDDLHEQAGSKQVHHMHGELRGAWCTACDRRFSWFGTLADEPECPGCGMHALRPDVVWFGEMPYEMDEIHRVLFSCDLFVSIGTSGVVYPAAGFVDYAIAGGSDTLELNLERAANSDFRQHRQGPATELVPAWVAELRSSLARP